MDYEAPAGDPDPNKSYWRWRWSVPCVLASYEQAKSYADRHPNIEGLTFVIHPFGNHEPRTRLICLDFDKCFDENGNLDPEVADLVGLLASYTEFSKSGRGLHVFVLVENCPAFSNCLRRSYGGCKVDLLCANAVNVTGNVYEGFETLETIDYSELEAIPFFEYKEPKVSNFEKPEWWSDDPLEDVPPELEYLIPKMEMVTAVEGSGGSLVLFAAACELMRQGITGREAESLLRCVPAEPEFEPEQIQRTIECAFNQTTHDGEFDNPTPEFEEIPEPPIPKIEDVGEEDREKIFGYRFVTANELLAKDLKLEWLVEGAFVGEGTMFIGGDQKTFKTGLAMDLLVSIATRTPFLNHFEVNATKSTAIFTAEIGELKAQLLLKSILQSRGLTTAPGLDIIEEVPTFGFNRNEAKVSGDAVGRLRKFLKIRQPEVVVFDPLYLSVIGGEAGDMYGMGAILNKIVEICREWGAWVIFCHHSKKLNNDNQYQPMRLSDFYGSGPAQYARQWCLVAHSEPFHHGVANLYATIGGSTQSREDVYEVKIDEGVTDELAERRWDVTVSEQENEHGSVSKAEVLATLDGVGLVTPAQLAVHMNASGREAVIQKVLHELVREGEITMKNTNKFELSQGEFND